MKNKTISNERIHTVLTAVEAHFKRRQTIEIEGQSVAVQEIVEAMQAALDAGAAAEQARFGWVQAAKTNRAARSRAHQLAFGLVRTVAATMGAESEVAAALGVQRRVPPKLSAEAKAVAVAKARATRAARGGRGAQGGEPGGKQVGGAPTPDDDR